MKKIVVCLLFSFVAVAVRAQDKLSLEKIWYSPALYARPVRGFNFMQDDRYYSVQDGALILKKDIETDRVVDTIFNGNVAGFTGFDDYRFSKDRKKIVFRTETERIYRHSKRARFYVYDGQKVEEVFPDGKIMYATLNAPADKLAFVSDNNLYVKDLASGRVTAVTRDGRRNAIINGASDWVYEEELGIVRAYEWSPDGTKIAFYRFDESEVKEYILKFYDDAAYPLIYRYKYPKVGEKNSVVDIFIYDLNTGRTVHCDTGGDKDTYIAGIRWMPDSKHLVITHLNRHQNHLRLLKADANTGRTTLLLEEKSKYYVDNYNNLRFIPGGRFLWTSDRSGYNHIYLYDTEGRLLNQITRGNWEVTDFYGFDEKRGLIYYASTEDGPLNRSIFSINLKGRRKKRLHRARQGWHEATFSPSYNYYLLTSSDANRPPVYELYRRDGHLVRVLEDNHHLLEAIKQYGCTAMEFFDFETPAGVKLNGWTIKPPLYDPHKKYPLLLYVYGGPGSQEVTNQWRGAFYWWFQLLAQKGYVVACVDNRGTGGRGSEFKKMTYLQLGKYETEDQIAAAEYLSRLPYIDEKRTGIFGWSYGGYMSSLCLLKGNDVFEVGVAVAPVTNWKWYDSIYTERFMRTAEENPDGYRENSPVYFADRLKGKYLLIHGLADDNVHYQNTAEMANALVMANKQFDTYVYTNRNHGIYGGPTRLHLFTKITNFILENL